MIQIITERSNWQELLENFENVDFYHTYDYHQLDKDNDDKPILLKYIEFDKLIAIPLLIRSIKGTDLYDATSVYGYAGPLTKNIDDSFDNSSFVNELKAILQEEKVISVFTRLNPFIPYQEKCLENIGQIDSLGSIVTIDLTLSLFDQKRQYHKRLRTQINKATRLCSVTKVATQEQLSIFIEMYRQTMKRIDAKPQYFFSEEYFKCLLNARDFKSEILLASDNESGTVIAGVLIIKIGKIVQYHLSGTNKDFLHLNPVKLLIDTVRIEATKEGYFYFNLGGGVGSVEDSLYRFKSGFSNDFKRFQIWKYICDNLTYEKLVMEKETGPPITINEKSTPYFPSYRNLQ